MSTKDFNEIISTIKKMKKEGVFENYIEYITFPFYKNIEEGTRINFNFPLTVLVGKNGSGKSSTLHALYGAPKGYSLSDFWFSTEVDPIIESGEANRFFYGYTESKLKPEIKEVMKSRVKRSESSSKKEDLDYWETCRPRKKDGMKNSRDEDNKPIRESPVNKDVVYIDFRAEISAFDKILHFSKGDLESRKDILRKRSKYINRLFSFEKMRFPGIDDEKKGKAKKLSDKNVHIISSILGKEYAEIIIAEHSVYNNPGVSAFIKSDNQGKYSEANAGSGEFAVIQLVRQIEDAPEFSLILLDEPEVSIHPGAQKRLQEYLLKTIIKKKLQIVICTHSPALIENIPSEAIKLYKTTNSGKFHVYEDITYQEAFFDIEDSVDDKKIILCEDYAAKEIISKTLLKMRKQDLFEVHFLPGGVNTLIGKYMIPFALNESLKCKIFFFLDGDQKTSYSFKGKENLTRNEEKDLEFLKGEVKKAYGMPIDAYCDGGRDGARDDQKCDIYIKYLEFHKYNIFYLSEKVIPEQILLGSKYVEKNHKSVITEYGAIDSKNAKEIVEKISRSLFGDEHNINSTISILANKWSCEENTCINDLEKDLMSVLNR